MSRKQKALFKFWAENNMNVLLEGDAGFGKTESIIETFDSLGWKWKYFSAATMDPWVDFIGVPKEHKDEDGSEYLKLVKPKEFQEDQYDAIFFDEFNRAPKKIRNAVMELIQFKSINGHKFNNLKVVWAAINPHDEEETYDVEKLDPAQIDRFHVRYRVPSVPDKDYFTGRYGKDMANAAIAWWYELKRNGLHTHVSARRLQYALDCYNIGGDIKYHLHPSTNPSKLIMALSSGSVIDKLKDLIEGKDEKGLRQFLKNDNNFEVAVSLMRDDSAAISTILPYVDEERIMRVAHDIPSVMKHMTSSDNLDNYEKLLKVVVNAGTLPDDEEKRIRSLLSRGVNYNTSGTKLVFTPNTLETTETTLLHWAMLTNPQHWNNHNTSTSSPVEIYQDVVNELGQIQSPKCAMDVLCLMFRLIETQSDEILTTKMVNIIPIINYIIQYLEGGGLDINSDTVIKSFTGNRKLMRAAKVQGFLDINSKALLKKPRVLSYGR